MEYTAGKDPTFRATSIENAILDKPLKSVSGGLDMHDSWHGRWCWRLLAPILRAKGHEVCNPETKPSASAPRAYIHCTPKFAPNMEKAKSRGWDVRSLGAGPLLDADGTVATRNGVDGANLFMNVNISSVAGSQNGMVHADAESTFWARQTVSPQDVPVPFSTKPFDVCSKYLMDGIFWGANRLVLISSPEKSDSTCRM